MFKKFGLPALLIFVAGSAVFLLPAVLTLSLQHGQKNTSALTQFPVTVDPRNKTIVENAQVNALFESAESPFQAAVQNTGNTLWNIFEWLATTVAGTPLYQSIAAAGGRFVTIEPGMRKEQVTNAFAKALLWNSKQKKEFITAAATTTLPLSEGSFMPGVYSVAVGTTPLEAQALVNEHFSEDVLSNI